MASLTEILAHHRRILVLDAASLRVQVGILGADRPPVWHGSDEDANRGVFAAAERCLSERQLNLAGIEAFVFCAGPGSMLGVRTVAMAIRTWQALAPRPAFAYSSLALLAAGLSRTHPAPVTVIADARRETWHAVTVSAEGPGTLRRATHADIARGTEPLFQPTAFRAWARPPRPALDCPYAVATLFASEADGNWWTPSDAPDAFQQEGPTYKKWSAQIHAAPAARS